MRRSSVLIAGESVWNQLNIFTGWADVDLSEVGVKEAIAGGQMLKAEGLQFDKCYTSYQKRAIKTLHHILEQTEQLYRPVTSSWRLNERHYGALQGLNKSETAAKHGEEQVFCFPCFRATMHCLRLQLAGANLAEGIRHSAASGGRRL